MWRAHLEVEVYVDKERRSRKRGECPASIEVGRSGKVFSMWIGEVWRD